jgi:predicted amino acid-binding ACT domain protein
MSSVQKIKPLVKKRVSIIDDENVKAFQDAMEDALSIQFKVGINSVELVDLRNIDLNCCRLRVKVQVKSDDYMGTFYALYTDGIVKQVYKELFNINLNIKDIEVVDCAKEMTNIVLGIAKAKINQLKGTVIAKSFPEYIEDASSDLSSYISKKSPVISIDTAFGPVYGILTDR